MFFVNNFYSKTDCMYRLVANKKYWSM